MEYSDYSLEQIKENCINYEQVCNMFFELTNDSNIKIKLEEILFKGGYRDYGICSKIGNRDNPYIEMKRRISMAYLLVRNPDTFDFFVENKINLFHGTNANALPSIIKHGINSVDESERQGIYVSTGEKWSRINGKRDFISLTDVLEVAEDYSTIKPELNDESLSFEIIVGTTTEEVLRIGKCVVPSDIPEVGVRNKLPLESIKVICVPSDKVEFVKKIISNDEIKVMAIDGINEKFYFLEDFGAINIVFEKYENLKENLGKVKIGKTFKLEEIKQLAFGRIFTPIVTQIEDLKEYVSGGRNNDHDRRTF